MRRSINTSHQVFNFVASFISSSSSHLLGCLFRVFSLFFVSYFGPSLVYVLFYVFFLQFYSSSFGFLTRSFLSTMDTVFNFGTTHAGQGGGYTRAERTALVGTQVIKVKEAASRQVLDKPIASNEEITSFDPEDLLRSSKDTNFFYRVTSWREEVQLLIKHCLSYYLMNVFMIVAQARVQQRDRTGNPVWETHTIQQLDPRGRPMFRQVLVQSQDASGNPMFEMEYVERLDGAGRRVMAMDSSGDPILDSNGNQIPVIIYQQKLDGSMNPIPIMEEVDELDVNGDPIPIMITLDRLDASGNRIPVMVQSTKELGSLFDIWNNLTPAQVLESCRIFFQHGEDVDRQNLSWSFDFVLNNVDANLKHYVVSEVESLPSYASSGPYAFYLVAARVMSSSTNLSHNINSGLIRLQLRHFQGEDVTECIFVLRNILKMLNHGVTGFDRTPPGLMRVLYDVFMQCSNGQFRSYMQQLHDFHTATVTTPEQLFAKAQEYYKEIVTSPNRQWLRVRKPKASFKAERQTSSAVSADTQESQHCRPIAAPTQSSGGPSTTNTNSNNNRGGWSRNRQPRPVDRNAPGPGEPTERVNAETGETEHWCSTCPNGGRWGNHNSSGHAEWYRNFLENKRRREERRRAQEEQGSSQQGEQASRPAPSTTFQSENIPSSPTPTSADPAPSSSTRSNGGNPGSMRRGANQVSSFPFRRTYVSFQDSDSDEE